MPNPQFYPLPTWSPLFEEPTHLFKGCTAICMLCRAPAGSLNGLVPFPLISAANNSGDLFHLAFMRTDAIVMPTYSYKDTHVVEFGLPVEFNGMNGGHCTLEYFDTDFGMAAGRELYGWPKKMGRISWKAEDDGRIHAEVQRDGHTLIMADFTPSGTNEEVKWPEIFGIADDAPYLQVRPTDRGNPGETMILDVIRQDVSTSVLHSTTPGTGKLRLFDGPTDPLSFLGPVEVLAARVDKYDFEFGWGSVVASVELADPKRHANDQLELSYQLRRNAGFPTQKLRTNITP
ncbi:acetoacetate decarboxylase family protein [Rhizobium leguminosarum]